MPSLQEIVPTFDNDRPQSGQFLRAETVGTSQFHRIEPELSRLVVAFNVNMRRLSVFETVEKEANSSQSNNRRHYTPRNLRPLRHPAGRRRFAASSRIKTPPFYALTRT